MRNRAPFFVSILSGAMCLTIVAFLALGTRPPNPSKAPRLVPPAAPGAGTVTIGVPRNPSPPIQLFAVGVAAAVPIGTFPAGPGTKGPTTTHPSSTSCSANRRGHAGEPCDRSLTRKERIRKAARWLRAKVQSSAVAVPVKRLRKLRVPHPYHKYLRHVWHKRQHHQKHHRRS